jgi:hypothetical protein
MSKKRDRNAHHVPARIRNAVQPLPVPERRIPGIEIKRAVKIALIQAELERRTIPTRR